MRLAFFLLLLSTASAFVPTPLSPRARSRPHRLHAEVESWRQYVPLAVSGFVIVDILLGSPFVNAVMRKAQPEDEQVKDQPTSTNPKERIDSMAFAQAALDKAEATKELRQFLESSKTDWDRMEEMRKKMDSDMSSLDRKLAEKKKE